jgi:hypothetical protein
VTQESFHTQQGRRTLQADDVMLVVVGCLSSYACRVMVLCTARNRDTSMRLVCAVDHVCAVVCNYLLSNLSYLIAAYLLVLTCVRCAVAACCPALAG